MMIYRPSVDLAEVAWDHDEELARGNSCSSPTSTPIASIDTDTHVIEPYDLWTSRVDVGRWGDKVPHVRFDEALQEDAWYFGDNRVGPPPRPRRRAGTSSRPKHPPRLDDVDPGTWEASARLNVHGRVRHLGGQVLYPNVAGFGAGKMLTMGDRELMLACVQAYNDFLTEYSSIAPEALHPDHGAAVLGPRRDGAGDRPLRGDRAQGRDHDRRAVLLGHAQARRPALGPAVGA